MRRHLPTLIATVGGLGRVPWAPGTWGSAVGLLLGLAAVRCLSPFLSILVLVVTFIAGALICTQAAQALGQRDPSAVILDEVWGMAAIIMVDPWMADGWTWWLRAFLLFRIFDVAKPPPVRQLERLPAGWGIMSDDLGAAMYTILALWVLRYGA